MKKPNEKQQAIKEKSEAVTKELANAMEQIYEEGYDAGAKSRDGEVAELREKVAQMQRKVETILKALGD